MTMVKVQAGQSILEGYIRTPLRGLTELVWNAFDEDAHLVTITCERNPLASSPSGLLFEVQEKRLRLPVDN